MENLTVSLIQSSIVWEQPEQNRLRFDNFLEQIEKNTTDIILLPETFSTGFTNSSKKLAETMDGQTIKWMLQWAKRLDAVVAGSLIVNESNRIYNRFVFAFPNGALDFYNKRHLFTLAKEHLNFSPGTERKIIEVKGWKIFPQVCYDLRFPVWSRNNMDYDLLIYVANWPSPRKEAWRSLLLARAIENQCYVAAVNRVGQDDNQLKYDGNSVCIDYSGKRLLELEDQHTVETLELEWQPMQTFREKLAFLKDQDSFQIETHFPKAQPSK